ncbi:transporter [Rhodoferax sp. OV413]|uniref:transporter n=1 Tax=Rhodoferax sp. OV413 TaxID=1855285 RepID=UPI0025F0AB35|nr:transporter [Rhodoferax sp. OV413]
MSKPSTPPTSPNYGADASGLIYGFLFDAQGLAKTISGDEALTWLAQPAPEDGGFVWLHFNLAHSACTKWLKENLQLSDIFHESLAEGSRSTRVELDDDMLVAVINDVHYDFDFEPSDISTLRLSVGPRLVVSARLQPLRSIDKLRDAVRRNAQVMSPVALLVHLMHDQGDVLVGIVRNTTTRVDELEDKLLAGRLESKRANLGSLRRLLVRLQRLLAPEPAALFRLLRTPPEWISEDDLDALRQSTEEFNVALSDMAALQERIKLLQEEIAGRVAEANNRSLYVLTIVTVLALPINMIAGLLGMNVGGIPLAEDAHGFWWIVALIISFTAVAAYFAFRDPRE